MANEEQRRVEETLAIPPPLLYSERARLIVLEGIDLSGRTTQVDLLRDWLGVQRYSVTTTAWRTSPLIANVLAQARTKSPLHPLSYSLLYCADHLDRTERVIRPTLARGEIVLADRYVYTAFARDEARGLDGKWVRDLYSFTIEPDVVFYLHISPQEAVKRRVAFLRQREKEQNAQTQKRGESEQNKQRLPKKSLASLTAETLESFHDFEVKMYEKYQNMQKEFGFVVVEGSQSVELVQAMLRRAVMPLL